MKTLSEAEAALKEMERDADKLRSRELRELVRECIEEYRQIIKTLRRFYN
ncbi:MULTISPECIES: hypothetical protein [unclassified Bradyrhizobium]